MAKKKSPKDSPLPPLVPQAGGRGAIYRGGVPGNRGGGRTPDEFKARLREMVSADQVLAYLDECLQGTHGPKAHSSAIAFAAERGYGKVPQALEHTGEGGGPVVIKTYAPKPE